MNFLQLKQDLADRLSAFDETVSSDATRLGRWINRAQDVICGSWDWPFLKKLDIIQTVADYATGTVSVTSGATTGTFSAGPAVSMTGRFIQFQGASDWYEITAHTAAATAFTFDPLYSPTASLSAGTFSIRKFYYGMDSTIYAILGVRISINSGLRLEPLSQYEGDFSFQMLNQVGIPRFYFSSLPTSGGLPQIAFLPTPSTIYNIYILGKKEATEMSGDTDTPVIPTPYHNMILELAEHFGFLKLNDARAKTAYQAYENDFEIMKKAYRQNKDRLRIVGAIDQFTTDSPVLVGNNGTIYWDTGISN